MNDKELLWQQRDDSDDNDDDDNDDDNIDDVFVLNRRDADS